MRMGLRDHFAWFRHCCFYCCIPASHFLFLFWLFCKDWAQAVAGKVSLTTGPPGNSVAWWGGWVCVCLCVLFCFFGFATCGILVPHQGLNPHLAAFQARYLYRWPTREVPHCVFSVWKGGGWNPLTRFFSAVHLGISSRDWNGLEGVGKVPRRRGPSW